MTARGRWTRRRKLLAACGAVFGLIVITGLIGFWWLYRFWNLHEPDPRPVCQFVDADTDAFVAVNIAPDDAACRELVSYMLRRSGLRLPQGQLPAWLTGHANSSDTILDLPGMLPAQFAIYYRYQNPSDGDKAFGVASFPKLPLKLRAAGAIGFRMWARGISQADPTALWDCDGAPVVRLRDVNLGAGEVRVRQVEIALLNKTVFGGFEATELQRAVRRFRGATANGPADRLAEVCPNVDFASDLVAAVRNQDKEVRRLLRMTENTPPNELPPDEFMLVNYGIDPDAMLGVSLQVNLETADRAQCRGFVLCPDAATAGTFAGLASSFLPRIGKPYAVCKVTAARADGPMVIVDFTVDGMLRVAEALTRGGASSSY